VAALSVPEHNRFFHGLAKPELHLTTAWRRGDQRPEELNAAAPAQTVLPLLRARGATRRTSRRPSGAKSSRAIRYGLEPLLGLIFGHQKARRCDFPTIQSHRLAREPIPGSGKTLSAESRKSCSARRPKCTRATRPTTDHEIAGYPAGRRLPLDNT